MSRSRGTSSLAALLSLALAAAAQERLEVQGPEPALVRLGEAARVQLCIHDPGGSLRDLVLPQVDGLSLRLQGPSQRESIVSVNGRVQRGLQVFYQVEVLPLREGTFVLPSFAVWTSKPACCRRCGWCAGAPATDSRTPTSRCRRRGSNRWPVSSRSPCPIRRATRR